MTAREECGMRHEEWGKSHECLLTAAIEEGDTRRGRCRPPSGAVPFAQAHAACGTCAQASHFQLKNNSFQLKSIKRNYFTLNQLRLAQESPRVAHKKKQNFYSALRFWETDWRQTTAERQQRARRRRQRSKQERERERAITSKRTCHGCSSLWYMGQAGAPYIIYMRERHQRASTWSSALLGFRANKLIWLSCVEMLAKCHLRWIKRPKKKQKKLKKKQRQKSFMSAPHK